MKCINCRGEIHTRSKQHSDIDRRPEMVSKIDNSKIAEVRRVARLYIEDEQMTERAIEAEAARDSLLAMLEEASEYDFTEADVVRAVLRPLFARDPKGCDCFTCEARRGEIQGDGVEEQAVEVKG